MSRNDNKREPTPPVVDRSVDLIKAVPFRKLMKSSSNKPVKKRDEVITPASGNSNQNNTVKKKGASSVPAKKVMAKKKNEVTPDSAVEHSTSRQKEQKDKVKSKVVSDSVPFGNSKTVEMRSIEQEDLLVEKVENKTMEKKSKETKKEREMKDQKNDSKYYADTCFFKYFRKS